MRHSPWLAVLLLSITALHAQGQTQSMQGRVTNGTTNRPAAKVTINYILMQQGTAPVATQVTDAEGRFRFENVPAAGNAPALLRAEFQGATYSHPLMPGQPPAGEIEIQVFEAGRQPAMVSVKEHAIFFHPQQNTLLVIEQVLLENLSQPPKTYVNAQGTYPFSLPGQPREGVRVTVEGPGGMPINQTPVPRDTPNSYAIAYPIRPGETQVRLEYGLDYQSPFEFSKTLDLLPQRLSVVTPGKEVQLSGETMTALGSDPSTGFTGYRVTPKGNTLHLQITGEVPVTKGARGEEAGEESADLVSIANPVNNQRWVILSATGVVMLVGFIYLYSRQQG